MARGNPKPTEKTNWIPDDTTNIVPPSAGRKLVGWLFNVKPPAEIFNWAWNLKSRFEDYFGGQAEDWIVIDSDADEGDYATLTAYLADAPAAGNRVLVKEDQTVTVQTVIPDNITLKFLDGSRLLCATNIATSVLQFGSDIVIEGVLNIVLSQTGVTAKAVELNGDNVTGKINIENSSTGTLTTGYHVNVSKTGNKIDGFAQNTGGGTLTNTGVDNSTEDSNRIEIVDEVINQIWRTRGAYKFREGLEYDLGSDADGDIYFRNSGVLQRLPKANNGDILSLVSGLPEWTGPKYSFASQIGNDFNLGANVDPSISALDLNNIALLRTNGVDSFLRKYGFNGTDWALVGNSLSIPNTGKAVIAALNDTDVAYIDDSNNDLRVYRLIGSTWTQIGNDLNITGVTEPALTALNDTDVVFIDQGNGDLRKYSFDGADFAQVENDLNIVGVTEPRLATMNLTDVVYYDSGNSDLRVYRFDGSDFAQVGNDLSLAGTSGLTVLSAIDVAFIDDVSDDLRIYRFDGSDFAQIAQGANISGAFFPTLTALNGTDVAFTDQTNGDLRLYRFGVSFGEPFRP